MFIEPEIFEISFKELKEIWKVVKKFNCVLIGGWAAFFLINDNFRKERKREYIGSRDIDFAVLSNDLTKVFEVMEKQGFFPISFRYCKIYSRELRKFVTESEASKFPLHDLFYFFVDFVTDAKPKNLSFTVFEDKIVKFIFENKLFLRKNNMRVVIPELFF
jgi:hypothetical protein